LIGILLRNMEIAKIILILKRIQILLDLEIDWYKLYQTGFLILAGYCPHIDIGSHATN
ncbi:23676_t:CDS:1, partial [Gigaspora rosea]